MLEMTFSRAQPRYLGQVALNELIYGDFCLE